MNSAAGAAVKIAITRNSIIHAKIHKRTRSGLGPPGTSNCLFNPTAKNTADATTHPANHPLIAVASVLLDIYGCRSLAAAISTAGPLFEGMALPVAGEVYTLA